MFSSSCQQLRLANKTLIQANKELTKSNQILEINYKSVSKKLRDLVGGDILDENARLLGELEEEREEKTAAFLMLKEAMEELDALAAMLEKQKEENDAHWNKRKRVLTLAGGEQRVEYLEPEEEKLKQKISLLSEDIIDRRLKSRYTIFAFCIALFFTWRSGSNANEELETLAIANEQQVEKMNLQLANAEKEKKTNLDKIAKLEEEAKKKAEEKAKKKVAKKKVKPKKKGCGKEGKTKSCEEKRACARTIWNKSAGQIWWRLGGER